MKGRITKLIGGLYTIKVESEYFERKARGKFRHTNESPKVGDIVDFDENFILKIYERKNELVRPPVANIDQVLLVFSATEPKISFSLLDRFISLITFNDIDIVLVVTKMDLLNEEEKVELKESLQYYETLFPIIYTKSITDHNFKDLKIFKDKISVLAGQSGVGKSTLINSISGRSILTQPISKSLGRGKHTTRHSELMEVEEGLVADTAGFSSLDFIDMDEVNLAHSFEDFFELSHDCKFRGCLHINEPKCNVKANVGTMIPQSRYDNYVQFMEEVKGRRKY
jgi:ribosome biogenesis GTPase